MKKLMIILLIPAFLFLGGCNALKKGLGISTEKDDNMTFLLGVWVLLSSRSKVTSVYVGGFSGNSSGIRVPGYWQNGVWIALPPLDAAQNSGVISLVVVNE